MSWDIMAVKSRAELVRIDDLGDEWQLPLGTTFEIREVISQVFPSTDWSEPDHGLFQDELGAIEFDLGVNADVKVLWITVHRSDVGAKELLKLAQLNRWSLVDIGSGEVISDDDFSQ